tara:strand:- start:199 stop:1080 length:882 start_codon:yes stop_codon:yes gene_type:complete
MKILFIGSVKFSASCLELLVENNENIVGVCTLKSSKNNSDFVDLKLISERASIPCLYSKDINSKDSIEWIESLKPDIIFCFGWSRLIKKDLLQIPSLGVIGFHPADLPKNRGRHPLIWAIALGLSETASTFFFMDEGADSGNIISQAPVAITNDDTANSLYSKITKIALNQILDFLPLLKSGDYPSASQDHNLSNSWRKRGKADGQIDWRMPAHGIYNLVRSLTNPYVGAHFCLNGEDIKVWKCSIAKDVPSNLEPGKLIYFGLKGPVIMTGDNAIELEIFEPKIKLLVGDYL